jgi:hypothetical protein
MAYLQAQDTNNTLPHGVGLTDMTNLLSLAPDDRDPGMPDRRAVLDILLASTILLPNDRLHAGGDIWTREASHRALSLVQLTLLLEQLHSTGKQTAPLSLSPVKVACKLAADYRSVMRLSALGALPCETLLTGVVSGLVRSCAAYSGRIALDMNIQSVRLEAPRRAALILLISELVISSLKHCIERSSGGKLSISLTHAASDSVILVLETSKAVALTFSSSGYEIVSGLAGIVRSDLVCRQTESGATRVEMSFNCLPH